MSSDEQRASTVPHPTGSPLSDRYPSPGGEAAVGLSSGGFSGYWPLQASSHTPFPSSSSFSSSSSSPPLPLFPFSSSCPPFALYFPKLSYIVFYLFVFLGSLRCPVTDGLAGVPRACARIFLVGFSLQ